LIFNLYVFIFLKKLQFDKNNICVKKNVEILDEIAIL